MGHNAFTKKRRCKRCKVRHSRQGPYCSELCEKVDGVGGSMNAAMWKAMAGRSRRIRLEKR